MPTGFVRLPLRHPFPLLISALCTPIVQQAGPDVVPLDVFDPEIVKIFERARYLDIKRHLTSTRVVGLARAEEGEEGLAAISVE